MNIIENYTFNVSVSQEHYKRKEDIQWNKQKYYKANINLNIFELLIKEGYNFCQCFNTTNKTFSISEKTESNWVSSSFVMLDIDDCEYTMDYTIENLEYKPTVAYTTYSNGKNDLNRFRLIYNFDEAITDIELYKDIYDSIKDILLPVLNNNWKDDCGRSVSQQFSGNGDYNKINLYNSFLIYNVNDFIKIDNKQKCNFNSIIKRREKHYINETALSRNEFENNDFIKIDNKQITSFNSIIKEREEHYINETGNSNNDDYWNLSFDDYLNKYHNEYPVFFNTPLEADDDTPYIILPDNYIEIDRYWIYDKNGNTYPKIIKNGNGRRKTLFINGILRRLMIPDISFDYLLYCLVYELFYFIDNTDKNDKITKKDLFKICKNVLHANLDDYSNIYKKDKRTFIINKNYCKKYNISPKSIIGPSRRDIRNYKIGNLYDCSLTDKENLNILKNNGINISLRTLKDFKKDLGITKYNKQKCNFNSIIKRREKHYINETALSRNEFENNDFINIYNDMKMIGKYTTEEFLNLLNNWYNITDIDELDKRWEKCKKYFYKNMSELTWDEANDINKQIQKVFWEIRPSLTKVAS